MSQIASDILNEIIAKLEGVSGLSVLDGYMIHYADDLLNSGGGADFPCVAVQLDSESLLSDNNRKLKLNRTYKLIGAIDAIDSTQVNQRLNNLLHDIRVALYSNAYERTNSKASSIELSNVEFKLPDNSDIYALLECSLSVIYVQQI